MKMKLIVKIEGHIILDEEQAEFYNDKETGTKEEKHKETIKAIREYIEGDIRINSITVEEELIWWIKELKI